MITDSGSEKKKGGWVRKRKQLRIGLAKTKRSNRVDEKCTGCKELRNNDRKTNCVILKKI